MRNSIWLFINGERHEVSGEKAFLTLSDYLRYEQGLTGTKVVCAEGDCGACTVVVARMAREEMGEYKAINSCIAFMWQLDRTHIITVEGLGNSEKLHPVQKSMVDCHGAQCGYCTPGFICAMASMADTAKRENKTLDEKSVRNALTGNLCRCTGYDSILEAGMKLDLVNTPELNQLFNEKVIAETLRPLHQSVSVEYEHKKAFLPVTLTEAMKASSDSRIVSGATDLGVLHNKGRFEPKKMMSLVAIDELHEIKELNDGWLIGARATLHQIADTCEKDFPEFSRLMRVFASPQIKNSATLVGNMMNASPIADTIPFLKVAHAIVHLMGPTGPRFVDVNDFFLPGYKQLDLKPGELVTHIFLPKTTDQFKLYKVSRRKDLDISAVTLAVRYSLDGKKLSSFKLAMGGVGASVLRFPQIEQKTVGQVLDATLMTSVAAEINQQITPVSDVRGSDKYRRLLAKNLLLKFAHEVRV